VSGQQPAGIFGVGIKWLQLAVVPNNHGGNEGSKGGTIPRAPNHYGGHRITERTPNIPTISRTVTRRGHSGDLLP